MEKLSNTSNGVKEIVFDVETKKSFDEVGGRDNVEALGLAVAGAYFYETDSFRAFEESELGELEELMGKANRLIGFNSRSFDNRVLQPYFKKVNLSLIPTTDIFEDVKAKLGHRLSLNSLASATLGVQKSSDGMQALEWFKQGKIQEVKEYCLKDVELTRDLYEYGKKNEHLMYYSKVDGQKRVVSVNWGATSVSGGTASVSGFLKTIQEAFQKRQRLLIEYISRQAGEGENFRKKRKIDVYDIRRGEIYAFCHLRNEPRVFKLESIAACEPTDEYYKAPQDVQASLF